MLSYFVDPLICSYPISYFFAGVSCRGVFLVFSFISPTVGTSVLCAYLSQGHSFSISSLASNFAYFHGPGTSVCFLLGCRGLGLGGGDSLLLGCFSQWTLSEVVPIILDQTYSIIVVDRQFFIDLIQV